MLNVSMRISFKYLVFFYLILLLLSLLFLLFYYYYYFIASRRWFLTYIYSNFENTFFGLSNLEFFIESLYASNICLVFFLLSLFSFLIFLYIYYYYYYYYYHYCYYHYYYCLCLCVHYMYRPCRETRKISSRFKSCLVLVF